MPLKYHSLVRYHILQRIKHLYTKLNKAKTNTMSFHLFPNRKLAQVLIHSRLYCSSGSNCLKGCPDDRN